MADAGKPHRWTLIAGQEKKVGGRTIRPLGCDQTDLDQRRPCACQAKSGALSSALRSLRLAVVDNRKFIDLIQFIQRKVYDYSLGTFIERVEDKMRLIPFGF